MDSLLSRLQHALGDRYHIEREVGRGGTGVVFAARDHKHDRPVAIKVLRPELCASIGADRFLREIRIAARLNHPNILSLIDSGEAAGLLYFVMFFVDGESLRDRIKREKQLSVEEALQITREVADALAYAHAQGVVHRDIKPENILFEAGHAMVADFGIAKAIGDAGSDRLTETGLAIGTPVYMSPEQTTGTGEVDARTDIYSLACVLYEMLVGSPPWVGATAQVLLARKTLAPVPDLRIARSTVPPAVEAAIARALAPVPTDRQGSIEEFIAELSARAAPRRGWRSVRRALAYGLAVLLTILVIATVARFTVRDGTSPPVRATSRPVTTEPGIEDHPSLSPDGEWVVYAGEGDGDRDIFLRGIGGQRAINLTGDSPADDTEPALSPDGDRIAFRSTRDGGGIFVMGRTGEGVRRVTRTGFNPAWSSDGTHLVYGLELAGLKPLNGELRSELWIVPIDGGDARRVSPDGRDALDPAWSPNGHRIAYTARGSMANDTGGMDIETVPAQGGPPVRVTADLHHDWSPAWSGDGRHLYFVSDRGGSMNLWRVSIDEETGRVLGLPEPIGAPAQFVAHPAISADGRRIAFSNVVTLSQNIQRAAFDPATGQLSDHVWLTSGTRPWSNPNPAPDGQSAVVYSQDRPEGDLYILDSDGSGRLRQLTSDRAVDRVPRWSPDGTRILYFSGYGQSLHVWTVRPDGSDRRRVSGGEGAGVAAWSPDGSRIAASTQTTVAIFDPSTPWDEQEPEWLPPTEIGRFAVNDWSPDGRQLAGHIDYRDTGIVTYTFATRTYRKLTDYGQWPVWLPDSRRIVFVSGGSGFHLLDTETGDVTRIYSSPFDVVGPPNLTRDGRQVFFSRRATDADIWLLTLTP